MEETKEEMLVTRMVALSMDCMTNLHEAIFLHLVDNKEDFYFVAAVANDCHAFFFTLKKYMTENHDMLAKYDDAHSPPNYFVE